MTTGNRQVQLMEERSILKTRSRFLPLTGWTLSDPASDLRMNDSSVGINDQDLAQVIESPGSRLFTEFRAACYIQYLFDSSLFTNKSGNNVPGKLWPLVKGVALDILVFSYIFPNGEIESEVVQAIYPEVCDVGSKTEQKLIDICNRLDLMTADQVRWPPNRPEEITDVGSMYSSLYYSPSENTASQQITGSTWSRMRLSRLVAGSTFSSTEGDMDQCPCCTTLSVHRRIYALVSPSHSSKDTKSLKVLMDIISREVYADIVDSDTKIGRISDMLKKYNQHRR
ncbi:hypothetical protein M9H77_27140 [Catharanthus roseus]|uniref:Uncharacterized protein n=1 Tax=Catharanthus roseus TaxID=4058 RepID=A0ACC0ABL8_CATRO|nr:hypothetical protein M9H77_27140 [Catharanthus roseus]